jgi:hypothetical protein
LLALVLLQLLPLLNDNNDNEEDVGNDFDRAFPDTILTKECWHGKLTAERNVERHKATYLILNLPLPNLIQ